MAASFDKCPFFKWVRCDRMIDYTWELQMAFLSEAQKHINALHVGSRKNMTYGIN